MVVQSFSLPELSEQFSAGIRLIATRPPSSCIFLASRITVSADVHLCSPGEARLQDPKIVRNSSMLPPPAVPTLQTERLIVRPWQQSDANDIFEYASDIEVTRSAMWPAHTSI